MSVAETDSKKLPKVLGPWTALCVVVGGVIGSGIFMVPAKVANYVPNIGGIAICWIVGGLFSAAGALTMAELGAMLPRAGGPYVYIREAYGSMAAFLFGWAELLVVRAGSIGTLSAAFAVYFSQIVKPPLGVSLELWQLGMAVLAIFAVTTINILGTTWAGKVQVVGTGIKVGALLVLIALPIGLNRVDTRLLTPMWPTEFGLDFARGILAAMVGILWAYDGWINVTPLAEEIRDPGRNVPRALIGGMVILITLYLTMTFAYHVVLPLDEIRSLVGQPAAKAVAADYCRTLLGPWGVIAISSVVMISTFISLNGNALTGPRSYFAMARDGVFPAKIAEIHPRFRTPANAILLQSGWAVVLTVLGTMLIVLPEISPTSGVPGPIRKILVQLHREPLYDLLYTYVIFGATLFYMLAIGSVFVLRVTKPDLNRPYLTWGYPWTPLIYIIASFLLLGNTLYEKPVESAGGLALIALGVPVYLIFQRSRPAVT